MTKQEFYKELEKILDSRHDIEDIIFVLEKSIKPMRELGSYLPEGTIILVDEKGDY